MPSITVHILHDNTLSAENREKFIYLAGRYNQRVEFHNVEELFADRLTEMKNLIPYEKTTYLTVAALYRLLIPQLFPPNIEKVIYLDSDLIVNLDVQELWRIELGDKPIAVVPEVLNGRDTRNQFPLVTDGLVKFDEYFNSGVMPMNLRLLREADEQIMQGIRFVSRNPRYQFYMDQDILNYLFSSQALKLPAKFNRFIDTEQRENNRFTERKIYHYVQKHEAFGLDINVPVNRLWLDYFLKTPWFDVEVIGRLYTEYRKTVVTLKKAMANTSAVVSGKTRAFFGYRQDFDALREIFDIRKDEQILSADEPDAAEKLIKAMKKSRGKKVFFIMAPNFPLQVLADAGLTPNRDFVNGLEFLSEANGVLLSSYELIRNM